jgi:heme oxygenase
MDSTMSTATALMTRLKEATNEHHRRAEGRKLQQDLLAGGLARETFAAYLEQLLHVHRGLEARLARLASEYGALNAVFQEHQIREADLLADLEFYGHQNGPATEATQSLLSDFDRWATESPVALLGALYVLEGSMNGNKFIARVLMREWSLEPGAGLRYLNPYGGDQPARWAAFRASVDTQELTPEQEAQIISAAQRTFDAIGAISDAVYGTRMTT